MQIRSLVEHREIRHFHLFAGLGGGAKGFNAGSARVGNMIGTFRCIGGVDVDAAAIRDFGRLAGVPGTVLDLFDRDQYRDFYGCDPPAGWRRPRRTIARRGEPCAGRARPWGRRAAGPKRGVGIVMNPQTGEVLAMVSLPTYDDNAFAKGISSKDFAKLANNKDKPLLNHAVQAHYPPGSTYKLVTGSGALADGKITATSRVTTRAFLTLGSTRFWEWNRRGWGPIPIKLGFAHSSDTFFYQLAGMLGIERLAHGPKEYGFGAPTGISLPGQVSALLPNDAPPQAYPGHPI